MSSLADALASELSKFKTGIGAWLVGTFLSTLVVGMILQQAFRYFRLYPTDPVYMKIWVLAAVVLQCLTTAIAMHVGYYYLVTYYLNPVVFTKKDVWTSAFVPIFGSINNFISESFFARRVYMIGRRYRIVAVISMILVLASCGFYMTVSGQAFTQKNIITAANTGGWLPTVGTVLLLVGDLQLTSVLVYFLHRSRTGVRRTNSMVDLLIAYTVSSGSLICILNIVALILSLVYPHDILYSAATLVAQTVYTSSFIVALNTRQFVRARGELDHSDLNGGWILGEKGPSGTAVNQVEIPTIVFAVGTSNTQLEAAESFRDSEDALKRDYAVKPESEGDSDAVESGFARRVTATV